MLTLTSRFRREAWHDTNDIALASFQAAIGVPGAEGLDPAQASTTVDQWVAQIATATQRFEKYRNLDAHRHLTDGQFLVLGMITVLQRDLGVRYNPACMTGDYDARDSRDHFMHGLLEGHGGTCSSLPFLYLAVGRRLNYPLSLVATHQHLFVRWEDCHDRFNIEATSLGFTPRDDTYYMSFPVKLTPIEVQRRDYLRSFTPDQELACLQFQRGRCLADNLRFKDAVEALAMAEQLDARYRGNRLIASVQLAVQQRMNNRGLSASWLEALQGCRAMTPEFVWAVRNAEQEFERLLRIHSDHPVALSSTE